MSSTYFKKDEYIERCNKQVKNIGQVIEALKYIRVSLPDNGKQFNAKQIKTLNEELGKFGCICDLRKDWYNKENTYLLVQRIDRSAMPCNSAEIGHRKELEYFKNGIMIDRDSVIKEIDEKINAYTKAMERYQSAPSKIADFIGSYQHLYDVWKSVRDFDMPEIDIDSISQYPPIR